GNNQYNGLFERWCNSIGLKKDLVYRLINRFKLIANCEDQKIIEDLPVSLTYEIAKPSSESTDSKKQAKEAVLNGEIKTLKEYKELEAKLRKAEEDNSQLEIKLKQEQEKQPEIVHEQIEIDNTDYYSIEKLKKQVERLESDLKHKNKINENINKQKEILEQQLSRSEYKVKEYEDFKTRVSNVTRDKTDIGRQVESITSLSSVLFEIEHLLKNQLAPVKYSRAITECRSNETAMNNLSDMIKLVESWCLEMRDYLPRGQGRVVDAQIIE
ncbi:hypothetical protein, partial [Bacillus velezensis]